MIFFFGRSQWTQIMTQHSFCNPHQSSVNLTVSHCCFLNSMSCSPTGSVANQFYDSHTHPSELKNDDLPPHPSDPNKLPDLLYQLYVLAVYVFVYFNRYSHVRKNFKLNSIKNVEQSPRQQSPPPYEIAWGGEKTFWFAHPPPPHMRFWSQCVGGRRNFVGERQLLWEWVGRRFFETGLHTHTWEF